MDGILPFLKPPGITSHDAVAICRRILNEKRIGHSGTLDPMAYGVLPIFLGKATRLIEYTDGFDKTYVAECKLGTFTDTEDSSGQPVLPDNDMVLRDGVLLNESSQSSELSDAIVKPTFEELVNTLNTFCGVQNQRPSKYSAIKVNGIRAYEYARKGISVELPLRKIHIKNIELVAYGFPYFTVRVTCSGGTYIRSLLRDICVSLGIPGTMTSLARTQVGPFDIGSAKMAEELMIHGESLLLPTDTAVSHLSKVTVNSVQLKMMVQGKQLSIDSEFSYTKPDHYYRAYGPHGFIGIMKRTNHTLKVEKNIFIEG
ncbi:MULTISPECIES: tRNA pseudouridine synthase B [Veillonella]|uniref:tRNA pseudouridine synthase B n=1 Tax=Veillonella fallax TaxID=2881272 RepID=A0ABS8F5N6_9FIRM|nr:MULTISPECIES: tRNA pseudouridine(55) synthase TruB [Veillonella]MBS7065834.1 pseudouridine synthase [Veillonella dispar]MCC2156959.1 pseudouridine synthase [Veillonella fallax]